LSGPTALTWLLASLATAEVAHVLIDAVGTIGAGGDAYEDHAHATVTPIALGSRRLGLRAPPPAFG
jgi:hypothetical protein